MFGHYQIPSYVVHPDHAVETDIDTDSDTVTTVWPFKLNPAFKAPRYQGLIVVHFSARPEPSLEAPHVSHKKCSDQAENWTSLCQTLLGTVLATTI